MCNLVAVHQGPRKAVAPSERTPRELSGSSAIWKG